MRDFAKEIAMGVHAGHLHASIPATNAHPAAHLCRCAPGAHLVIVGDAPPRAMASSGQIAEALREAGVSEESIDFLFGA